MSEAFTQEMIREMAVPHPALFFELGVSILDSLAESPKRSKAGARLFECDEFLKELISTLRYSGKELKAVCAEWIKIDGFLDVRLARLLPGRHGDPVGLTPELAARVLEVLHHISTGPRLIILVNHLKHHPNPLVAERATLLVGRRIRNFGWIRQRLTATDGRVRAAAVEALWGDETPTARLLLLQSRDDKNSQVVANAFMGLHFLGEINVYQQVNEMACDERSSFRGSAVWAMGQMGRDEFLEPLRTALEDSEAEVRGGAKVALVALRKQAREALQPTARAVKIKPVQSSESGKVGEFGFRFDGSLHG